MRVLIVQPWIRAGGAELLSVQLAAALEQAGDEAPIAALYVAPHGLPAIVSQRRYVLPPRWLAACFARSRAFTYLVGPAVLLALVVRAAGRADVLNPHNLPAPLVTAVAGVVRRRPVVWTCNEVPEPLPKDQAVRLGGLESFVWRVGSRLGGLAARAPQEILVLSDKTRSAVRAAYGRDATVVRPGVDLPDFEATHRSGEGSFGLLFVAKLHPQKDPLLAVRVLAAVRESGLDARLTLVGDGPERASVESLARSLGVEHSVRIERHLDLLSLVDRYRSSDALIVTAGGHQSWGLTPFEALAAGTPSIISSEAGASEVLGAADAALVVPRDAAAFAGAVRRLATEPDLRPRLIANGQRLNARLTWERYALECRDAFGRAVRRA
jgi:glycosyltransferase involved in cell wall biosynthesis